MRNTRYFEKTVSLTGDSSLWYLPPILLGLLLFGKICPIVLIKREYQRLILLTGPVQPNKVDTRALFLK